MLVVALMAQAATSYNFYVGGVLVTSDNCSNITGSNITGGTAVFTPSNNTLTLTNVTITRTGTDNRAIQSDRSGLIVKLVGTNSLSAASSSVIRFNQPGSIVVASGTTTVTGGTEGGVYSNNVAVSVSGPGKLIVKSTSDKYGFEGKGSSSSSTLTFSNVTLEASGKKGALYDWSRVTVNAGSSITLKATYNSSYPVASNLGAMTLNGNEIIMTPSGAYYNAASKGIVLNGNLIYNSDIYITDDYALLINAANFPDANFRNYMLSNFPKGYMTTSDVNAFTDVYVAGSGIASLEGIQHLTALRTLDCSSNSLTSLDVSACTQLLTLNCANNKFTSLEIINMPNLTTLKVSDNQLLTELKCDNNALTTINLNSCTQLESFQCSNNYLGTINVSSSTKLKTLYCNNNKIKTIDLSQCPLLEKLSCTGNQIATFTITGKTKLKSLNMDNNASLNTLYCYNNALTTLTLTDCDRLQILDCHGNSLTSLNLSDCYVLQELNCYSNKFTQSGMNSLISSLFDRSTTFAGTMRVLYNSGEQNVFNDTHVTNARAKNWLPYQYDGSTWTEMGGVLVGDVNGDGSVSISDVTALIDYLLGSGTVSPAADVNDDGNISISDVTALIDLLLDAH